ncbi:hypothetical protein Lal_00043294 [Lupinus albus]|nr:hypothetical protein Lal_00043294 [Lupinus albus]
MARVCGICTSTDHYSDVCPSLLDPRTGYEESRGLKTDWCTQSCTSMKKESLSFDTKAQGEYLTEDLEF